MKNVSCSSRRAVAFLMALVMVISILTPFHFTKEVLAYTVLSENDVEISNLVLTIGGNNYSAGVDNGSIQVNNGDAVKLSFNWNVNNSNVANVTDDIQIAIDLDLQGLTLDQTVNSDDHSSIIPYTDEKGVNMGYYSIVNNIMTLYIYADYWNTYSNRSGKASLDGEVVVTADGKSDQVTQTVSVDGSEIIDLIVNVDVVASTLSGNKEKTSVTANADGSATATFKYTMTANNGTVSSISLTDTPSGLNDTSSITLNYNGSSTTYNSWSALNSALASMNLSTTDSTYPASAYITYDMVIPATSYDPSSSISVTNRMEASYKDDVHTDPQTTSTTLYNIITKPSVNKSGSLSGELVTWNITINPGDLGENAIDWSTLADNYSEDISASYNQNITLTKDMFTKNSDGTYTYTYVTAASEESLDSTEAVAIRNTTSIKMGDYTYSNATSVNTNPGSVTKTLTSTDGPDASGYLTWTVSIPIPDTTETIKNFRVIDDTYAENGGTHLLYDSEHPLYVYIGSNSPTYSVATTGQYANYTNYTTNSNGTIIYTAGVISENSSYNQNTETFALNEDYVNAHKGETLTITYKSFSKDATTAGKTYVNMVTTSYKIGTNTVSHSSQASWKDETVALTYKKGNPGSNETITYSLGTALSYFGDELTAGEKVTIVDTLPEGLTYQSIVGGWICSYNQYYQAKANDMTLTEGTDYTVNVAGQVVTFTLTLTDEMIAEIQEYHGTSDNTQGKGFYVEFIAEISDHVAYTTAQSFTNSAKGTYGSTNLDTAKVINTIEPVDILEKTHKFSSYKKGILSFTVDINPLELNLDNKDNVIEAVDQLGSKLILLENTLRVYTVDDSGNKTQITSGWSYTYNYDTGTITFSLPDEKHLYITYDTQMDIPEGAEVTFDTGGNTFTIDGVASTDTSDQFSGEAFIVTYDSSVVGYGETGSLTIYKYWINVAGTEIPLSGSSFSIYYASVDKTDPNDPKLTYDPNSTPIYTSTTESSSADSNGISTTVDGNTIIINGLRLDNAFALVEADAPEGFEVSDTVRYFLLRGNDYGSLDADLITALKNYGNIYFGEQSLLLFENEPSASATLPLYASKKLDDLLSIPSTYVSRFGFTVEQYDTFANAQNGTSGSKVATGTVDTKGDITFSPKELTFDETGTYYLRITEDDITHAKTASEVEKDSSYYIVEVLVSESTTAGVTTKKATIQKVSHYEADDTLVSDSLAKAFTSVVFTNKRNFTTTLSLEAVKFFNYTSVVPSGAFNFTIAPLSYNGNPSEDGYWAVDSYTEGSSLELLEGTFSDQGGFTLSGDSVTATVDSSNATTATASDTGAIVWEDVFSYNSLTIGDEGSFNYIIYETDPASAYASSVTVDSSFYILHVDVARNAADNNYDVTYSLYYYQNSTDNAQNLTYLGTTKASSVTVTADDNNRVSLGGSSIDFYNTSKKATLDFYVQKDLDGNSSWTTGQNFSAKITQVSGMGSVTDGVLKEAATITDNAISFDDLSFDGANGIQNATATFTSAGTYYFRIAETIGSDENIVYDDTIYYATVEVSLDSSTGALTPEITAMTQYVTTNGKTMAVDYLSTYRGNANATDGAVILYNKTAYKTGVFFEAKKTFNSFIPGDFTFNFGLTNLGNNNWSDANAVVDALNTALASSGDVASAITSLASYESNISANSTTYKFGTLRTNAATNDADGNITFGSSTSPAITYTSTEVDGIGQTSAKQYLVMRESDLPSTLASNVTKDENLILVAVDLSRSQDALTATKTYYLLNYDESNHSYSLGASSNAAQTFDNTSRDGSTTLNLHKLLNDSAILGDRSFTMKIVEVSDAAGTTPVTGGILTRNNNGGDGNSEISVTLNANTIHTEDASAALTFTTTDLGTYYFKIYEDDTNGDKLLEYDSNYYILTVNVGVQSYYDTNHNVNSDAGKIAATKTSLVKYDASGNQIANLSADAQIPFENQDKVFTASLPVSANKTLVLADGATPVSDDPNNLLGGMTFTFYFEEVNASSDSEAVTAAMNSSTKQMSVLYTNQSTATPGISHILGTSNANGTITFAGKPFYSSADEFSTLTANSSNTHYYKISERNNEYSAVDKDTNFYLVKVTDAMTTDTNGDPVLEASVDSITKYSSTGTSLGTVSSMNDISFVNTMEDVEVSLNATKHIIDESIRQAKFRFYVFDEQDSATENFDASDKDLTTLNGSKNGCSTVTIDFSADNATEYLVKDKMATLLSNKALTVGEYDYYVWEDTTSSAGADVITSVKNYAVDHTDYSCDNDEDYISHIIWDYSYYKIHYSVVYDSTTNKLVATPTITKYTYGTDAFNGGTVVSTVEFTNNFIPKSGKSTVNFEIEKSLNQETNTITNPDFTFGMGDVTSIYHADDISAVAAYDAYTIGGDQVTTKLSEGGAFPALTYSPKDELEADDKNSTKTYYYKIGEIAQNGFSLSKDTFYVAAVTLSWDSTYNPVDQGSGQTEAVRRSASVIRLTQTITKYTKDDQGAWTNEDVTSSLHSNNTELKEDSEHANKVTGEALTLDALNFHNTSDEVSLNLHARKYLDGLTEGTQLSYFSFTMTEVNGDSASASVVSAENGHITGSSTVTSAKKNASTSGIAGFDTITFTYEDLDTIDHNNPTGAKDYYFKIKEDVPTSKTTPYVYDDSFYIVTVRLYQDTDGLLVPSLYEVKNYKSTTDNAPTVYEKPTDTDTSTVFQFYNTTKKLKLSLNFAKTIIEGGASTQSARNNGLDSYGDNEYYTYIMEKLTSAIGSADGSFSPLSSYVGKKDGESSKRNANFVLEYDLEDLPDYGHEVTYYYRIMEDEAGSNGRAGLIFDEDELIIAVKITRDSSGNLSCEVYNPVTSVTYNLSGTYDASYYNVQQNGTSLSTYESFTNRKPVDSTISFNATKMVNGIAAWKYGNLEFDFNLVKLGEVSDPTIGASALGGTVLGSATISGSTNKNSGLLGFSNVETFTDASHDDYTVVASATSTTVPANAKAVSYLFYETTTDVSGITPDTSYYILTTYPFFYYNGSSTRILYGTAQGAMALTTTPQGTLVKYTKNSSGTYTADAGTVVTGTYYNDGSVLFNLSTTSYSASSGKMMLNNLSDKYQLQLAIQKYMTGAELSDYSGDFQIAVVEVDSHENATGDFADHYTITDGYGNHTFNLPVYSASDAGIHYYMVYEVVPQNASSDATLKTIDFDLSYYIVAVNVAVNPYNGVVSVDDLRVTHKNVAYDDDVTDQTLYKSFVVTSSLAETTDSSQGLTTGTITLDPSTNTRNGGTTAASNGFEFENSLILESDEASISVSKTLQVYTDTVTSSGTTKASKATTVDTTEIPMDEYTFAIERVVPVDESIGDFDMEPKTKVVGDQTPKFYEEVTLSDPTAQQVLATIKYTKSDFASNSATEATIYYKIFEIADGTNVTDKTTQYDDSFYIWTVELTKSGANITASPTVTKYVKDGNVYKKDTSSGTTTSDQTIVTNFINSTSVTELVLTAKKQLTGTTKATIADYENEFTFTITGTKDDNATVVTEEEVTNDASGNITFPSMVYTSDDIGSTYHYVIAEKEGEDASIEYSTQKFYVDVVVGQNTSGEIVLTKNIYSDSAKTTSVEEAAMIFVNKKVPSGELELTKTIDGIQASTVEGDISFEVKNSAGETKTYQVKDDFTKDADGVYHLLLENLPVGEYVVTEKVTDASGAVITQVGYSLNATESVVKEKSQDVDLTSTAVDVTVEEEETAFLDFTNTYEEAEGELEITKTIVGDISLASAESTIYFLVKNNATGDEVKYPLSEFTRTAKDAKVASLESGYLTTDPETITDETLKALVVKAQRADSYDFTLSLDASVGSYTVTEVATAADGRILQTISYVLSTIKADDTTVVADAVTDSVSKETPVIVGGVTKLSFTNTYVEEDDSEDEEDDDDDDPKTGDSTPLALLIVLVVISALVLGYIGYTVFFGEKKKDAEDEKSSEDE